MREARESRLTSVLFFGESPRQAKNRCANKVPASRVRSSGRVRGVFLSFGSFGKWRYIPHLLSLPFASHYRFFPCVPSSRPVYNEDQIFCALKYRLIAPGFSWDFLRRLAHSTGLQTIQVKSARVKRDRATRFTKSRSIFLLILNDDLSPVNFSCIFLTPHSVPFESNYKAFFFVLPEISMR